MLRLSVLEHFPKFMQCVEMLDQTQNYAADICALYHSTWYMDLQTMANSENYVVPPQPRNESNAAARMRLQEVRDAAHQAEVEFDKDGGSCNLLIHVPV